MKLLPNQVHRLYQLAKVVSVTESSPITHQIFAALLAKSLTWSILKFGITIILNSTLLYYLAHIASFLNLSSRRFIFTRRVLCFVGNLKGIELSLAGKITLENFICSIDSTGEASFSINRNKFRRRTLLRSIVVVEISTNRDLNLQRGLLGSNFSRILPTFWDFGRKITGNFRVLVSCPNMMEI